MRTCMMTCRIVLRRGCASLAAAAALHAGSRTVRVHVGVEERDAEREREASTVPVDTHINVPVSVVCAQDDVACEPRTVCSGMYPRGPGLVEQCLDRRMRSTNGIFGIPR